jgi:hypothetical protein
MDEDIRRQRDLILQMDDNYRKQISFLKSRIARLEDKIKDHDAAEAEKGNIPSSRPAKTDAPLPLPLLDRSVFRAGPKPAIVKEPLAALAMKR